LPRDIRGTEHKDTSVVVPDAIHLNEKFGFDATGALRLSLVSSAGE
jgi:hypothetical protein